MGSSTVEQLDGEKDGGSTPPPYTQGVRCKRPHAESNAFRGPGSTPGAPEKKLFIIGRRDLPPGLRAAQMFHAARLFAAEHPFVENDWFRSSNTIVLLEVENNTALEEIASRATHAHATMTAFSEPEMELEGITALAIGPDGWRVVSSLPLALQ